MKCSTQRQAFGNPFFSAVLPSFFEDAISKKEFSGNVPAVNIAEDEKHWQIEVSAAGFTKEDFSIKLEKEILTVSAEHKQELTDEKKSYSRREFRYGSFSRSFRLPKGKTNEDGINASYENGILKLSIPKKEIEQHSTQKEFKVS